jgi:hypothetical protein
MMASFLILHGRQRDPMQADGNCLYRALSKQLANDSEQHGNLRAMLVKFAAHNVRLLKCWVTSSPREILQKTPEVRLKEHLDAVSKLGSWGTQLEIVAAATLFQVDIYVATDSLVEGECRWTRFTPLKGPVEIPPDIGSFQKSLDCKRWIEIAYENQCHYNSVLPLLKKRKLLFPPRLMESSSTAPLTLLNP